MISIYVGGTFDLFHEGHKELLDVAMKLCDEYGEIIVAVNSDSFVERHKGSMPINNEIVRMANVRTWIRSNYDFPGTYQIILLNKDEDQKNNLVLYDVDFVLHGNDWDEEKICKRYGINRDWLMVNKITLIYKDRYPGISSTTIREQIYR